MTDPQTDRTPGSGGRSLLVCAPLRVEARALRRGLRRAGGDGSRVIRTGYGPGRSGRRAADIGASSFGMMAVAGVAGGLVPGLEPGDLVVATEVGGAGAPAVACPSAPLLAGELRRAGLRARTGKIVTVDHLADGADRARLADDGAQSQQLIDLLVDGCITHAFTDLWE